MANEELRVVGARPARAFRDGESDVTTELDCVVTRGSMPRGARASVPAAPPVDPHAKTLLGLPPPLPAAPRPEDRRIATRVALEADVSLFSPTTFWAGFTEDISEGGLFVATYEVQPIGTRMDLRFELPTGHAVSVSGVVRWHRPMGDDVMPGMGIAFENLSAGDARVIQTFIKHRPPLLWDVD
jgi:uncharacterized protein (TIGR02266 family)